MDLTRTGYFPPKPSPWQPADYDESVTAAVRAFHSGVANAGQQKVVWTWLTETVCGDEDWPFRPEQFGGQRATDVALGKMFVARQLKKQLSPLVPIGGDEAPAAKVVAKPKRRAPRTASKRGSRA